MKWYRQIFGHNIMNMVLAMYYKYYNRLKFRLIGVELGGGSNMANSIYLNVSRRAKGVKIGDWFSFRSGGNLNPLSRNIKGCIVAWEGASIKIGNSVGISSACIWIRDSLTIGNNVKIGGNAIIMDSDQHSMNYQLRRAGKTDYPATKNAPIVIEDDVLIGTGAMILKGVTIGARSVIGAGSVVTKDIPADCIAAGNPCRVIKRKEE